MENDIYAQFVEVVSIASEEGTILMILWPNNFITSVRS